MRKIYLLIIFIGLICFSFTSGIQAQISTPQKQEIKTPQSIEGLKVFQSPATRDILYITSKKQLTKTVRIFNVLGKQMLFKVLIGEQLDVSTFPPGIYVLKVTEGNSKSTFKLVLE